MIRSIVMKAFKTNLLLIVILGAFALIFAGCGGGNNNKYSTASQGTFVDSPVEGLQYETPTQSGITGAQGTFQYLGGEIITFSVGDIVLGQAVAKATITPVDLVGGALNEQNPTVTNIARFLLSLDLDGNWDNGISISEEIRNECLGRVIDFNQTIADFENDPDVQNLLDTLNALGVFPGVRALCPSTQAQTHLGETIDNYMGKWVVTLEEEDEDNDGTIDDVDSYTYDANGNLIKEEEDDDNDGTIDEAYYYTYDANGNMTKEEGDWNPYDGTIDEVYYYTYDANGNMTKEEGDEDNDGTIDYVDSYTYDANGNMIKAEYDWNPYDGTIDDVEYYTYDANGNLIKEEDDYDNDGTIDYVEYYTYDANGNMIKEEYDWDNDGTIDSVEYFTYDANGNPIKEEYDWDNDGTIDRVEDFTYDANGNMTKEEEDWDNDGTIDSVEYYTYDANGNLTKIEEDWDNDGTIDYVEYITWQRI